MLVVAAAAAIIASLTDGEPHEDLILLPVIALICAAANLFEIFMPGHWSFQPNLLFFFAGAVLLPPWAVAVLAVACFIPGFLVNRKKRPESFPWYKVSFNVANYLLAGLVAHWIANAGGTIPGSPDSDLPAAFLLLGAAVALAAVNHLLIVGAIWLAGERSLRTAVRQLTEGLPLDIALCLTGACLAVLWNAAPALVVLAPGPVFLVHRALGMPLLARRAEELRDEVGLLQTALLPQVPPQLGELSLSVAYRPAEGPAAGGDFYDAFELEDGRVVMLLGDVSGHGRDALARSALMRYTLRAYLEAGLDPRGALKLAGRAFDTALGEDFATAVLAVHSPERGTLTYSSAGHPPPLVIGPLAHEPITPCSAPPIGVGVPTGLRQTTIPVAPGMVVCLFTDGLVEARVQDVPLGRERLAARLASLGVEATAQTLIERVVADGDSVRDDMAACVVRVCGGRGAGGEARVEELECDAEELQGSVPQRFLEACGLPPGEIAAALAVARAEARGRDREAVLRVHFGEPGPGVDVDVLAAQRQAADRLTPRRPPRRPAPPVSMEPRRLGGQQR